MSRIPDVEASRMTSLVFLEIEINSMMNKS